MAWNPGQVDSQILAVHAALVPSGTQGQVVLFGGDEHSLGQAESGPGPASNWQKTRVYDVAANAIVAGDVDSPASDVFCSHHAFLADGRLLIAGGTSGWGGTGAGHVHDLNFLGHSRCWIYNARQSAWVETTRLNRNPAQPNEPRSGGRWYPGLVTLSDGSVLATFGHVDANDNRHRNTLPERYVPGAQAWFNLPVEMGTGGAPNQGGIRFLMYARAFLLPGGKVFFATPMPVLAQTTPQEGPHFSTAFDVSTGQYDTPRANIADGVDPNWDYPAVLLPLLPPAYEPHILFLGRTPRHINLAATTPDWVNTSTRQAPLSNRNRVNSNAILLPTGDVCWVGGVHMNGTFDPGTGAVTSFEDAVLQAEIFRPSINWSTGAYTAGGDGVWSAPAGDAAHARNYHSSALLLPNGKVWVAGGNTNASAGNPDDDLTFGGVTKKRGIKRIELFEPDYVGVANRIQITNWPRMVTYTQEFDVTLDRPATNVDRVAFIRNGSVTHNTNNDQRYVGLEIVSRAGNTIRARCPRNGSYAPPGYYMLWVVDTAGNPCQLAQFVRVAHLSARVIANRSTFSQEEIQALGGGGAATVPKALYADFDGFLASEIPAAPTFEITWQGGPGIPDTEFRLVPAGRLNEVSPPSQDATTRVTFAFDVVFPNMNVFANLGTRNRIQVTFHLGVASASAVLELSQRPNPYMIDIDPALNNEYWLSTDVRVLKVRQNEQRLGVTQTVGGSAPHDFLRSVLDRLRNGSADFNSIDRDGDNATLDAAYMSGNPPRPTFNYGVARVRYRALGTPANNVRCFFRMCNAATTGLEYDATGTYNRTPGADPKPLVGTIGGAVVSIPFFSRPRQNTVMGQSSATGQDTQQIDPIYDVLTIPAPAGAELHAYFGCYLDITEPTKRFPLNPVGIGPYPDADSRSIRDLIRSWHNCLVAEVYLDLDPTPANATPADSDNLSQRNLAIVGLENPGQVASRTAMLTFEVAPSQIQKGWEVPYGVIGGAPVALAARFAPAFPDELLFDWGSLPAGSIATVYFSDVSTTEISKLLTARLSAPSFTILDEQTIRFKIGDCGWLPLPGGRAVRIPVLLSVSLPDTVVEGQVYRVTIRQVNGRTGRVIGAVTLEMPVYKASFLKIGAERELSFMRHIATTIPTGDRWKPIFDRYLGHLAARVDALGGDARKVEANPDGTGLPYTPVSWQPGDPYPQRGFGSGGDLLGPGSGAGTRTCWEGWAYAALVALCLVFIGMLPSVVAVVLLALALIGLPYLQLRWKKCCKGRFTCALLDRVALGAGVGLALTSVLLVGGSTPWWSVAVLGGAVLLVGSLWTSHALGCRDTNC